MKVKKINRDVNGLLVDKNVKYIFEENGMIDWRKMINSDHLYANPSKKLSETDVSKLEDNQLCILLSGLKELAQIRGYTKVEYDIKSPSLDYVVATCKITWVPNYETEGQEVTFSAVADSSVQNTAPIFGNYFLATTAENRAFARCVRSFLRINIVSKEEMAESSVQNNIYRSNGNMPSSSSSSKGSPEEALAEVMKEKRISFDRVKTKLVKEKVEGAADFESISDIPKQKVFQLIDRIKNSNS